VPPSPPHAPPRQFLLVMHLLLLWFLIHLRPSHTNTVLLRHGIWSKNWM
jgi:hypothetical protein